MDIRATIHALRRRISGEGDQAEAAKAAAEEVSKALPGPVMPRPAVLKKRKQMEDLDKQTKED